LKSRAFPRNFRPVPSAFKWPYNALYVPHERARNRVDVKKDGSVNGDISTVH
jgi:hypothetical protein